MWQENQLGELPETALFLIKTEKRQRKKERQREKVRKREGEKEGRKDKGANLKYAVSFP